MKFNESSLAHKYLDGLKGIEIGASAHNPFNIKNCVYVDYSDSMDTIFKKEEENLCGKKQKVDVVSQGDDLPFEDNSLDYVLSSHVIEHFFDPIKAIKEWLRVLKVGGYIFLICPQVSRVKDEHRPITTLQELIDRHVGNIKPEDIVMEGGHEDHRSIWDHTAFLELCNYLHLNIVEFLEKDEKVGNGFCVVIKKVDFLYDIVIPSWNQEDLVVKCLESIKKYSGDYRVIFVDNASEKSVLDSVKKVLIDMPHLLLVNKTNLGFVKAVNQGLYLSSAPYVVIMNNDTEAAEDWLVKLKKHLVGKIMLSGPKTTAKGSWQGDPETMKKMKINMDGINKVPSLAFFCVMMRREIFDICGYLDEDFGVGFGDDDNYCWRVNKAGYELVFVGDLIVPHHHRSTFNKIYKKEEIKSMQENALKLFKSKQIVQPAPAPAPERLVNRAVRINKSLPKNIVRRIAKKNIRMKFK